MKVLHVYKCYLPDDFLGVARVIHSVAEGTTELGVENKVFALADEPADGPLNIGSHMVHQTRRSFSVASMDVSFGAFAKFRKLSQWADIIHYHFPWPMGDLLHLLYANRKPAIVTYHSDVVKQRALGQIYAPLRHQFLSSATSIVATSPNYLESSTVLRKYKDKVAVIPIGIPDREKPSESLIEDWRRKLALDEPFFLFVGALRYYKGITFLVEAARLTGLPVVVAGNNKRRELDVANLPANVAYVGEITDADKEALLDLCAAFVFPSHLRSEAFGVALLEAARAGKPMISCELGTGTSYVNAHGRTGLAVAAADVAELSRAMKQLDANVSLRSSMGNEAASRFEQLFRAEAMSQAYLKLYRGLAELRQ